MTEWVGEKIFISWDEGDVCCIIDSVIEGTDCISSKIVSGPEELVGQFVYFRIIDDKPYLIPMNKVVKDDIPMPTDEELLQQHAEPKRITIH